MEKTSLPALRSGSRKAGTCANRHFQAAFTGQKKMEKVTVLFGKLPKGIGPRIDFREQRYYQPPVVTAFSIDPPEDEEGSFEPAHMANYGVSTKQARALQHLH